MFKNLIFYVDACYSGSLFNKMKIPDNVYIVTACGVTEVTYSCKYDSGLKNYPCDLFSHAWITDMEQNNKPGHTFNQEFDFIQQNIIYCHACRYGEAERYGASTINSFFQLPDYNKTLGSSKLSFYDDKNGPVLQYDVPLALAQHLFDDDPTEENRIYLQKQLTIRKVIDTINSHIIDAAKPGVSPLTLSTCSSCDDSCPCYQSCVKQNSAIFCKEECCNDDDKCNVTYPYNKAVEIFDKCLDILDEEYINACGTDHPYLRKADGMFYHLCRRGEVDIEAAVKEIHRQCSMFKKAKFF